MKWENGPNLTTEDNDFNDETEVDEIDGACSTYRRAGEMMHRHL
jgi:hypothetical protein